MWEIHRHHHKFYNPSPFAVIADEWADQLVRASPLLTLPLLLPVNMDMLFFTYTLLFYGYGTYLHWGHEFDMGCASDMKVLNGSYEHYLHHAIAIKNKP
jgi:lathosterol oxidase